MFRDRIDRIIPDLFTISSVFLRFSFFRFSRMHSEGFLFSFLVVWEWWTVCRSFSCRGALIARRGVYGESESTWWLCVKVHFTWQAWNFVALKRKLFFSLMASSPLSMGKVSQGDGLWRVTVHFTWQAWDFVAKWRLWSEDCALWSVQCEVWSVKCAVWSVQCEVWNVKCEVCSLKCGVWSVKCEVWSVECEVWSVPCEVWSVKCGVWSVQCEVWSVKCEVWSVECEVWSLKCAVWSVKCGMWSVKCAVWSVKCEVWSVECAVCSVKWEVWSVKCGVGSLKSEVWSVQCEVWNVKCEVCSVKCEVWSVECGVCSVQCEVRSVKCEVWSGKSEVWSLKSEVCSVKCEVWSVKCEVSSVQRAACSVRRNVKREVRSVCMDSLVFVCDRVSLQHDVVLWHFASVSKNECFLSLNTFVRPSFSSRWDMDSPTWPYVCFSVQVSPSTKDTQTSHGSDPSVWQWARRLHVRWCQQPAHDFVARRHIATAVNAGKLRLERKRSAIQRFFLCGSEWSVNSGVYSDGVGWGRVITFMFLCTHRHSNLIIFLAVLQTQALHCSFMISYQWGGVGWGNNVHVPVHAHCWNSRFVCVCHPRHVLQSTEHFMTLPICVICHKR